MLGLIAIGVIGVLTLGSVLTRGDGDIELGFAAAYRPGAVVYFSSDRLFVVHIPGGAVTAFSDIDPHAEESESKRPSRCRVTFLPDLAEPGEYGRFFDACTESMYDISGRSLRDDGLDLRRIPVYEDGDRLRIRRSDAP
jgi:hypothetical protein